MITRILTALFAASISLAGQDAAEIVRRSVQADQQTLEKAKDYTYEETAIERDLDASGRVKSTDSKTFDVLILYGRPFRKLIAKNGRPLPRQDQAREDARLQKAMDERKRESEGQIAKRQREREKEQSEFRKVAAEIPVACKLTLAGEEQISGRPAYVIQVEPKTGFKPATSQARFLSKMRGKLWIDKSDYHWAKVEAEPTDTISFGLVIARLSPGTRIEIEQVRINDEIWAPSRIKVKLDARLALLKKYRKEIDVSYTGYRKFKTDSRVVAISAEPVR
jgi:hypothetical protein